MQRSIIWLLLCFLLFGCSNAASPQQIEELRAQIERLEQQLAAAVAGAEAVHGASQPFIPGAANTQRTVARAAALWPQHFSFLSAVSADARVTCSAVLTDRPGLQGSPLFFVLGDAAGRLYFFAPEGGHLLHEHDAGGGGSGVTALSSDLARANESHLLVGLGDGTVMALSISHEHVRLRDGSGIHSIQPLMVSTAADRAQQAANGTAAAAAPILHIMFGMSQNRRMVLAVDASNRVLLLMASSGRVLAEHALPAGTPLAAHLHANFQLVVQTGGAAVVLLVKRGRAHVLRPCEGLTDGAQPPAGSADGGDSGDPGGGGGGGGSGQAAAGALVAAAFDPARSFRVFGVTAGGHLLVLTVPSGAAAHQCRVMQRIKLGLPPGPVHLVAGSGSLVLLHAAGVAAFSVSAHKVALAGSLRVSHTWEQLWQLHGLSAQHRQLQATDPGAAAAWEGAGGGEVLHTPATGTSLAAAAAASGLLLLPLGDRGAAVFGMAARAPGGSGARFEGGASTGGGGGGGQQQVNWVKLAQPFVVVGMLVVGAWQFIRASSRANLDRFRTARYGGRYGSGGGGPDSLMGGGGLHGLEGLSPDDISSAMGLWGGAGFGPGMDRDLGPYAGPRGRRPTDPREQLAGYGGLGALTARRRARAAMFSNRQQPGGGGGGGAMQQQSLGGRQGRGAAAAGIARAAQLAAEEDAAEQQQRQRQRQERLAASGRGVHFADQRSGSGSEGGASPPGGGRPASAGEEGEGSGGSGSWEQRPAAPASQTRAPDEVPIIPGRIGGFGAAAAPGSGASTACDSDAEAADAGALAAQLAEAVGHVPAKRER